MKTAQQLKSCIKSLPRGKAFTARSLREYGSYDNVRQVLSRMARDETIKRIAQGIYIRPKKTKHFAESLPSATEIAKMVAQESGEIIAVHGAEAARSLSLTTQVPMQPIFHTTGNTRKIKAGNLTITFKHISPRKLVAPGTIVCTVISALWYLGKNNVTTKTINQIKNQLSSQQFKLVTKHIQHMPAWMAEVFYQYQKEQRDG